MVLNPAIMDQEVKAVLKLMARDLKVVVLLLALTRGLNLTQEAPEEVGVKVLRARNPNKIAMEVKVLQLAQVLNLLDMDLNLRAMLQARARRMVDLRATDLVPNLLDHKVMDLNLVLLKLMDLVKLPHALATTITKVHHINLKSNF
jgi:hypothetical protein